MTTDATAQLIQRILSQLSSGDATNQSTDSDFLAQAESVIGIAANYVQILSTVAGGAEQAAAIIFVGSAQAATASALAQAKLLIGSAAAAGIGSGIVLIIAALLTALMASEGSGSSEAQQIAQLSAEIEALQKLAVYDSWKANAAIILSNWDTPQGGLGTDLDNLANQGTQGQYVKADVGGFHDHALDFVNIFIPAKAPPGIVGPLFWQRPIIQTDLFSALNVPYPGALGVIPGWYGTLPQPQSGTAFGGSADTAADPRSMLPYLIIGIQSYLTIQALVNIIDPNQPTFAEFVAQFQGDLKAYADFLYSLYQLAVNGIAKSDLPSSADVLGFLSFKAGNVVFPLKLLGSNPFPSGSGVASAGYMWNGIYGVVDTYPKYGIYQPPPPVSIPSSSPACLIDIINTDNLGADLSIAFPEAYLEQGAIDDWIQPWIENKLKLGIMARWKAIYLLNGYDKVWSMLQSLYTLVNPKQPPPPMPKLQDGTIPDGNWSVRELCSFLNASGYILDGTKNGSLAGPGEIGTYSLFSLVQVLDNIANGNWIGPQGHVLTTPFKGLSRPVGFRDRLAAAAV